MDITEICATVHNYFPPKSKIADKSYIHSGKFTISDGSIAPLDFIKEGQYFRINGSDMNDRVICKNAEDMAQLVPEEFEGEIWAMAIPPSFIALCKDIMEWIAKNESPDSVNMSPYMSESFAGYSYSKGYSTSSEDMSNAISWKDQFASRLTPWRKVGGI